MNLANQPPVYTDSSKYTYRLVTGKLTKEVHFGSRSIPMRPIAPLAAIFAAFFVAVLLFSAFFGSDLGNGGGEALRRGLLAAWLATALVLASHRSRRVQYEPRQSSGIKWLQPLTAALLALAAASTLGASDMGLAIGRLGDLLLLFASLILASRLSNAERVTALTLIFLATSLASLATAIFTPWPLIDTAGGILSTRNLSATLAAIGLPFTAQIGFAKNSPKCHLALAAAFASGAYLLICGNRLGAIAGISGLALLFLSARRWPLRQLLPMSIFTAAALLFIAPSRTSVTVTERLSLASASLTQLTQAPLFGVGTGQWAVDFPRAAAASFSEALALRGNRQPAHAHNDFLELGIELGLPAALILVGILALGMLALFSRVGTTYTRAAAASVASFALLCLAAFPLAQPSALILLGFLLFESQATARQTRQEGKLKQVMLSGALLALTSFSIFDILGRRDLADVRRLTSGTTPNFPVAAALSESARHHAPWSFSADRLAAWTLSVCQRPLEALAAAEAALTKRPWHPGALNDLALCLRATGRIAEAESLLRDALVVAPSDPEVALNLAGLLAPDADHEQEAEHLFRQALKNNVNLTTAWEGLAKLAQRRGNWKDSIALQQAARDSKLRNQLHLKNDANK